MKLKPRQNQAGFTIIEVIVTLFIMGTILVLYQASSNTIVSTTETKNEDIALRVATTELQTLRAGGYSSLPASGTFTDTQLTSIPSGAASMTLSDYNATTKQVTVTVTWADPRTSKTKNVSLTTLIANSGGL
jgi:prepilin-type N-terminal cleavage/methylation domain-containing protein